MAQSNDYSNEAFDEISLGDAHYKEDSEVVPDKITHEYVQRNSVKGILREFSLFDDIYLYCSFKYFNLKKFKSKQLQKHRIDLTYIDSKPAKSVRITWKWLLWSVVTIAASALVIYIGEFSDMSFTHQAILPVGILLGTFGFVSFLLFYYKSYNNVIYRSYVGRVTLIELAHKPRDNNYKEFIDVLEESIYKAQHRNGITIKDRLVGEMKDMRRLRDAGIISEKKYKQAQTRIFDHEANQV
jgi:hypothetical protein